MDTNTIIRTGIERWNAHDRDGFLALYDDSVVLLDQPTGEQLTGREEFGKGASTTCGRTSSPRGAAPRAQSGGYARAAGGSSANAPITRCAGTTGSSRGWRSQAG